MSKSKQRQRTATTDSAAPLFAPKATATLAIRLPDMVPLDGIVRSNQGTGNDLALQLYNWVSTGNGYRGGILLLAAETEFAAFPLLEHHPEAAYLHAHLAKAVGSIPKWPRLARLINRMDAEGIPRTRAFAMLVPPRATKAQIKNGIVQARKRLRTKNLWDASARNFCYGWLGEVNLSRLKEELEHLGEMDFPGETSPASDKWRDRIARSKVSLAISPEWQSRVQQLFADLPNEGDARWQAITELRAAIRDQLARELTQHIAETFRGKFDEEGRPLETLQQMQQRSAQVRAWLNEFGFALVNPLNAKPCQPFAAAGPSRPQYVLAPVGKRDWSTSRKLSTVSDALQHPQLTDRPSQSQRAFGRDS